MIRRRRPQGLPLKPVRRSDLVGSSDVGNAFSVATRGIRRIGEATQNAGGCIYLRLSLSMLSQRLRQLVFRFAKVREGEEQ